MAKITEIRKKLLKEKIGWKKYHKKYPKRNFINEKLKKEFNIPNISNKEKSKIEIYDFLKKRPKKYTAYMGKGKITTWTGDELAKLKWVGSEYQGGFGSKRENFRAITKKGDVYSGTHFKSSGDYVNMKRLKKEIKRRLKK